MRLEKSEAGILALMHKATKQFVLAIALFATGPPALANTTVINNIFDLQNIQNDLSGNYVLGGNIDASVTASWNGGAGFSPLGTLYSNCCVSPHPFVGVLDGQGYTIS